MTTQQQRFAVKHAATGMLFAGFDKDGAPLWSQSENNARAYATARDARGQALLFRCFDVQAQIKAVAL